MHFGVTPDAKKINYEAIKFEVINRIMISLTGVVFPISLKHSTEAKPITVLGFCAFLISS